MQASLGLALCPRLALSRLGTRYEIRRYADTVHTSLRLHPPWEIVVVQVHRYVRAQTTALRSDIPLMMTETERGC